MKSLGPEVFDSVDGQLTDGSSMADARHPIGQGAYLNGVFDVGPIRRFTSNELTSRRFQPYTSTL